MMQQPELGQLRDIVFLFKAMYTPNGRLLPEPRQWALADGVLRWGYAPPKGGGAHGVYSVGAFGAAALPCCAYVADATGTDRRASSSAAVAGGAGGEPSGGGGGGGSAGGSFDRASHEDGGGVGETAGGFLAWLGFGEKAHAPRAPPSAASAAAALRAAGHTSLQEGEEATELDVLHARRLPDFGGRLGAQSCERLLTYLTAPYVRIPLILHLMSRADTLPALASSSLQALVDAAIFEPCEWQQPDPAAAAATVAHPAAPPSPSSPSAAISTASSAAAAAVAPAASRAALGTPCGLLFNELVHSPGPILAALTDMLAAALELDVGFFDTSGAAVILYVLRLVARVEGYVLHLLSLCGGEGAAEPMRAEESPRPAGPAGRIGLCLGRGLCGAWRAVWRSSSGRRW